MCASLHHNHTAIIITMMTSLILACNHESDLAITKSFMLFVNLLCHKKPVRNVGNGNVSLKI